MNAKSSPSEPELSHPISIEKISASGIIKILKPNEEERQRLAKRFDLLELSELKAELTVNSVRGRTAFAVTGDMTADVVQKCVVTLEPVPAHVEAEIDTIYVTGQRKSDAAAELDPEEVETETVNDGVIDLGELVAQSLGIALDPYPRKPGVAFEKPPGEDGKPAGPFAKLAELKKKEK